jgi:hypothetical protein
MKKCVPSPTTWFFTPENLSNITARWPPSTANINIHYRPTRKFVTTNTTVHSQMANFIVEEFRMLSWRVQRTYVLTEVPLFVFKQTLLLHTFFTYLVSVIKYLLLIQ